jgi:hypothetical protein
MNNREQFINEIAEVVNRNSMEKAFNDTPDFILARIAVEAMENQPERKREYKKPEAHNVPKEVEAMAAFFADMFPGSEIQIQRVDLKKNPRNKCRAKNKRKGGRRNEK